MLFRTTFFSEDITLWLCRAIAVRMYFFMVYVELYLYEGIFMYYVELPLSGGIYL